MMKSDKGDTLSNENILKNFHYSELTSLVDNYTIK